MGDNKGQYPVTDGGIRAGTPDNYGKNEDVKRMLVATNPTHVSQAGRTYLSVAKKLSESMSLLETQARALAQHWSGSDSSVKAQQSLQLLYGQSNELSGKNYVLGSAFEQCGTDYLQWYQDHIPGTGLFHTGDDDWYAQQYLQRLNVRYQEIFGALPSTVDKDLPNVPGGVTGEGNHLIPGKPGTSNPLGSDGSGGGGSVPSDPFDSPGGVPSGSAVSGSPYLADPGSTDPTIPSGSGGPGGPGGL
ncbi:MAG TPA: hypothetical protein VIS06_11655, partial [Mycobacteriales bacterium]